jgi:hypothetical protein
MLHASMFEGTENMMTNGSLKGLWSKRVDVWRTWNAELGLWKPKKGSVNDIVIALRL